jgi:hypothetical protein
LILGLAIPLGLCCILLVVAVVVFLMRNNSSDDNNNNNNNNNNMDNGGRAGGHEMGSIDTGGGTFASASDGGCKLFLSLSFLICVCLCLSQSCCAWTCLRRCIDPKLWWQ